MILKFRARYERDEHVRRWSATITCEEIQCSAVGHSLTSARIGIRRELGLALGLAGFAELLTRAGAHAAEVPAALARAGVEIEDDVQVPMNSKTMVERAREAGHLAQLAQQHAVQLQQLAAEQLVQADVAAIDIAALLGVSPSLAKAWAWGQRR